MALPVFHIGQTFETFEEFQKFLQEYQVSTKSYHVTKNSKLVSTVNQVVKARGGVPYKEALKYTNLVLCCKRGGIKRIKTGDGSRELQGYVWLVFKFCLLC